MPFLALLVLLIAALTGQAQAQTPGKTYVCVYDGTTCKLTSASNPLPVTTTPSAVTQVTLDVKTVTTGGTAVNALSAGHRTHGGWLKNPDAAAASLCINEIGTASGTVSSGDTTCIAAGQTYSISPGTGAVSVVSSDSSHTFSGVGFN
jgi:hypothetical protein